MNPQSAQRALDEVRQTMLHTRRAIAASGTDLVLMLWGLVWIACYGGSTLWSEQAGWIWLGGNTLGIAGTFGIFNTPSRRDALRGETARQLDRQIFWFWLTLFLFADIWLMLLWPWDGLQLGAFGATLVMFAYIVLGLWLGTPFMIGLGILVTVLTVTGYLLAMFTGPGWFGLWMAVTAGGALFITGLYVRLAWR